ncbi:MAG: 50S ribosomal protein L20 [Fibrobacteres bacterium]|nr:50S ribosomal protein L20 [Fibrobacterota bacterium]
MPRVKKSVASRARRKRVLDQAKGYRGFRNNKFKFAKETLERGMKFAYKDRKAKKRSFRELWNMRINAAARMFGLSYSRFMDGLKKGGILLNRKVLADLAVSDLKAFEQLALAAKTAA